MNDENAVAVEARGLTRVFGDEKTRVEALRGIDLRVRRKGFTAHARRGYYAPWEGPPG